VMNEMIRKKTTEMSVAAPDCLSVDSLEARSTRHEARKLFLLFSDF